MVVVVSDDGAVVLLVEVHSSAAAVVVVACDTHTFQLLSLSRDDVCCCFFVLCRYSCVAVVCDSACCSDCVLVWSGLLVAAVC